MALLFTVVKADVLAKFHLLHFYQPITQVSVVLLNLRSILSHCVAIY